MKTSYGINRIIALAVIASITLNQAPALAGFSMIPEKLVEQGIEYYKQGREEEALEEFNKALLVNPDYKPARDCVAMIKKRRNRSIEAPEITITPPRARRSVTPEKREPAEKDTGGRSIVAPEITITPPDEMGAVPRIEPEREKSAEETRESGRALTYRELKERALAGTASPYARETKPRSTNEPRLPQKIPFQPSAPSIQKEERLSPDSGTVPERPRRIEQRQHIEPPAVPEAKTGMEQAKQVPGVMRLDEASAARQPIELDQGATLIIRGNNIVRSLATQDNVLSVARFNQDEIRVTGNELGRTYLHLWEGANRTTLEFRVVPDLPEGPTFEEEAERAEELMSNFKVRLNTDWSTYEQGERMSDLERSSYAWNYGVEVTGESPYGYLDGSVQLRRYNSIDELTWISLGIREGAIGEFKGFEARVLDFYPDLSNLIFPGSALRGVYLKSPFADPRFDYTAFWGRERTSAIPGVSPAVSGLMDSSIGLLNLNFEPAKRRRYSLTLAQRDGVPDRRQGTEQGYDFEGEFGTGNWDFGLENAYDSRNFANVIDATLRLPRFEWRNEARNISKNFNNLVSQGWRAGERGYLTSARYRPSDPVELTSSLDIYQNRLYANPDNPGRWNQDFDLAANVYLNQLTTLRADYAFQNQEGYSFPFSSHDMGIGLSRTFEFIHRLNLYGNYRHRETEYSTLQSLDYDNDRTFVGARLQLMGNLYGFLNREDNWTNTPTEEGVIRSYAHETGLEFSGPIGTKPLHAMARLAYRDEETPDSSFSFLSGEDYLELSGELTYTPNDHSEAYVSADLRDIYADSALARRRAEVNLETGMRYMWDTGLRWEAIGDIDGFVFKDKNYDGLMQDGEQGVEGVMVTAGKKASGVTDTDGYFRFPGIRAKKIALSIDRSSIPAGFVMTAPATQEIMVAHQGTSRVLFGMSTRTEISGFIFVDIDGDGKPGGSDIGVGGVDVLLDGAHRVATNASGKFLFKNISPGLYTVRIDLKTLPTRYLPLVPIFKEMLLNEGSVLTALFPLKNRE